MSLSKKQASVLLAAVLLVGLAMFFLTPIITDQGPSDPEEPENPVEENDEGEIEQVNFEGVTVLPDGSAIVFSDVIADNHREQLLNKSAVIEYQTASNEEQIKKFGNRVLVTDEGDFRTKREYTDGVLKYESTEVDGEAGYSATRGSINGSRYYKGSLIRSVLEDLDVRSIEETSDGISISMRGSSEMENLNTVISDYNEITEASADVNISNSGTVTGIRLQMIGPNLFGVPQSTEYNYNVTQIGDVSLDTPTWVSNVKNQVAIMSSEVDTESNWIELEHEGLAAVPSSANVTILTSQGESANLDLSTTVSSGDTIYLSRSEDSWQASVNQQPTPGREIGEDSEVIVSVSDELNGEVVEYYGETITIGS